MLSLSFDPYFQHPTKSFVRRQAQQTLHALFLMLWYKGDFSAIKPVYLAYHGYFGSLVTPPQDLHSLMQFLSSNFALFFASIPILVTMFSGVIIMDAHPAEQTLEQKGVSSQAL